MLRGQSRLSPVKEPAYDSAASQNGWAVNLAGRFKRQIRKKGFHQFGKVRCGTDRPGGGDEPEVGPLSGGCLTTRGPACLWRQGPVFHRPGLIQNPPDSKLAFPNLA
jgi:hypothetical protein